MLLRVPSAVPVAALAVALSGCHGCDEKPYTPFGIASVIPSGGESGSTAPSGSAAPKARPSKALVAPRGATSWELKDRTIRAPRGRVFEQALVSDFAGEGTPEIVAWTAPERPSPSVSPGELWAFPTKGAPHKLAALPGFVPTGPTCELATELSQTGAHSLLLDATAHCKSALIPRSPVRALVVVEPAAPRPVRLVLRVAAPAPGQTMKLAVDSSDRDGDGQDDVALTVSVRARGSRRPASAKLVWLARAAGLSLEANEPARSFDRLAARALLHARRRSEGRRVHTEVNQARRLFATLCEEGGVPRLFDADGTPFRCRGTKRALSRLAEAKALAALRLGDVLEASGVLTRDGWYGFELGTKVRARLARAIEHAAEGVEVQTVRRLHARPIAAGSEPRWSPLRFEPAGALLVQTSRGLVRAAADGSSEVALDTEAGVTAWPLQVTRADGTRWAGVAYACDRPEVLLTLSNSGSAPPPPVSTRLLAPRPGPCTSGKAPRVPRPTPLGWTKNQSLEALVAGSLVGPLSFAALSTLPVEPGSPRSPDGHVLVVPTALGLLVLGAEHKPELWTASSIHPLSLSDCVVANQARAVACVQGRQVVLFERAAAAP